MGGRGLKEERERKREKEKERERKRKKERKPETAEALSSRVVVEGVEEEEGVAVCGWASERKGSYSSFSP